MRSCARHICISLSVFALLLFIPATGSTQRLETSGSTGSTGSTGPEIDPSQPTNIVRLTSSYIDLFQAVTLPGMLGAKSSLPKVGTEGNYYDRFRDTSSGSPSIWTQIAQAIGGLFGGGGTCYPRYETRVDTLDLDLVLAGQSIHFDSQIQFNATEYDISIIPDEGIQVHMTLSQPTLRIQYRPVSDCASGAPYSVTTFDTDLSLTYMITMDPDAKQFVVSSAEGTDFSTAGTSFQALGNGATLQNESKQKMYNFAFSAGGPVELVREYLTNDYRDHIQEELVQKFIDKILNVTNWAQAGSPLWQEALDSPNLMNRLSLESLPLLTTYDEDGITVRMPFNINIFDPDGASVDPCVMAGAPTPVYDGNSVEFMPGLSGNILAHYDSRLPRLLAHEMGKSGVMCLDELVRYDAENDFHINGALGNMDFILTKESDNPRFDALLAGSPSADYLNAGQYVPFISMTHMVTYTDTGTGNIITTAPVITSLQARPLFSEFHSAFENDLIVAPVFGVNGDPGSTTPPQRLIMDVKTFFGSVPPEWSNIGTLTKQTLYHRVGTEMLSEVFHKFQMGNLESDFEVGEVFTIFDETFPGLGGDEALSMIGPEMGLRRGGTYYEATVQDLHAGLNMEFLVDEDPPLADFIDIEEIQISVPVEGSQFCESRDETVLKVTTTNDPDGMTQDEHGIRVYLGTRNGGDADTASRQSLVDGSLGVRSWSAGFGQREILVEEGPRTAYLAASNEAAQEIHSRIVSGQWEEGVIHLFDAENGDFNKDITYSIMLQSKEDELSGAEQKTCFRTRDFTWHTNVYATDTRVGACKDRVYTLVGDTYLSALDRFPRYAAEGIGLAHEVECDPQGNVITNSGDTGGDGPIIDGNDGDGAGPAGSDGGTSSGSLDGETTLQTQTEETTTR